MPPYPVITCAGANDAAAGADGALNDGALNVDGVKAEGADIGVGAGAGDTGVGLVAACNAIF